MKKRDQDPGTSGAGQIVDEALDVLRDAMRNGDAGAAKVIVQTQTPKLKPILPPVAPGLIDPDASPLETARQAVRLAAEGRISPDQAKAIAELALTAAKVEDVAGRGEELDSIKEEIAALSRKARL